MDLLMLRGFLGTLMLGMAVTTIIVFCQVERTPLVGLLLAVCWGLLVAIYLAVTRSAR